MTYSTTTEQHPTDHDGQSGSQQDSQEQGQDGSRVLMVDPASVVIDPNVRTNVRLDKAFVASIRARGVLVPVVGWVDEAGAFHLEHGQRRTLAAIEAEQALIPAYVTASKSEADRVVDQLAENDHRTDLTSGERARAFEQLSALGMSAAQIAKQTGWRRADVTAGLAAASSDLAAAALDRYDFLTLDQGAVIAEFDDDREAVKALTVAARDGQFEHVAQRLRDDRDRDQATALAVEALTAEGVSVVPRPAYGEATTQPLKRLAAKKGGPTLTPAKHAKCAGHAAYVEGHPRWVTGKGGKDVRQWDATVTYVCTAWKDHGHHDTYASDTGSRTKAADMTAEQREQARAERRDVIDSNKAWDAAEPVRRAFLATLATRKTAPKGTATLLARALTTWSHLVSGVEGDRLAADLLGVEVPASTYGYATGWGDLLGKATEPRALMIALVRVLASIEKDTGRHSWRSVREHTAAYLTFLATHGYDLSPVEHRAAGTTDQATDQAPDPAPDQQNAEPDDEPITAPDDDQVERTG